MAEYKVFSDKYLLPEVGEYVSYGICVYSDGKLVLCVPDVVTDSERAEKLVCLCNGCGLDPIHLADVIEDFLY